MNKQEIKELLEFAGVDITKGKAKTLIENAGKPGARWISSRGPNDTPGYALQIKNTKGVGLRQLAWVQEKPKTNTGNITDDFDDRKVNLDDYDFNKSVNEGWGAAGQKRQQEEMAEEGKKYRQQIKDKNPEALKAYDAWVALGKRGKYAAKDAVEKGMPK